MKILITGSNGFIGKNLVTKLKAEDKHLISSFNRHDTDEELFDCLSKVDCIVHLAGENRPEIDSLFEETNVGLTKKICNFLQQSSLRTPIIYASSIQATSDNLYGKSKLQAENVLLELNKTNNNAVAIFRLPGVFGKWSKPNYNSVVSTFCYNLARDLPIEINDPSHLLSLSYIDDVVHQISNIIEDGLRTTDYQFVQLNNIYKLTVGELADKIKSFSNVRKSLITEKVGEGITRALYSTYVSYLKPKDFSYILPSHQDERGTFVEMLKTINSGQFSFFTAHPGVTRGGHYHHTKTEKFLVIKGEAQFGFRNIITNERHFLNTSEKSPEVVETVPGWTHDITNTGNDDLIVMLWANEIFNQDFPDTYIEKV
tara:strand:+ start:539 stop:1651 length:1113 start_codon:yes stop_codon:yes gene_type:complete